MLYYNMIISYLTSLTINVFYIFIFLCITAYEIINAIMAHFIPAFQTLMNKSSFNFSLRQCEEREVKINAVVKISNVENPSA